MKSDESKIIQVGLNPVERVILANTLFSLIKQKEQALNYGYVTKAQKEEQESIMLHQNLDSHAEYFEKRVASMNMELDIISEDLTILKELHQKIVFDPQI